MDEVREKWEELRLLLCVAQQMSEELAAALRAVQPLPVGTAWSASDRLEWRTWWDKYTELDYDLWQAYCHGHQAPSAE